MAAKLKKEQVEAIEAQVRLGLNIHEIALATGFSLSTISKYVEVMRAKSRAVERTQ